MRLGGGKTIFWMVLSAICVVAILAIVYAVTLSRDYAYAMNSEVAIYESIS